MRTTDLSVYDACRIYDGRRRQGPSAAKRFRTPAGRRTRGACAVRLTATAHLGYARSMKEQKVRLPGGELEYAVLFSVCELGRASAREVYLRVGAANGLAYTTIAKVLDRLHVKGLVTRKRKGLAFVYRARLARRVIEFARARVSLGKLLGPAPGPAVATLVEAMESLDPGLLDELERAVAARREARHGS